MVIREKKAHWAAVVTKSPKVSQNDLWAMHANILSPSAPNHKLAVNKCDGRVGDQISDAPPDCPAAIDAPARIPVKERI
jgi:hypothetical protein